MLLAKPSSAFPFSVLTICFSVLFLGVAHSCVTCTVNLGSATINGTGLRDEFNVTSDNDRNSTVTYLAARTVWRKARRLVPEPNTSSSTSLMLTPFCGSTNTTVPSVAPLASGSDTAR